MFLIIFFLFILLGTQTQNTVYEIVSDMSSRQDAVEERLTHLEDKIQTLQVSFSFSLSSHRPHFVCISILNSVTRFISTKMYVNRFG